MDIKYFLDKKNITSSTKIDFVNGVLIRNGVQFHNFCYYGFDIDKPIKVLLGHSKDSTFCISGFRKKADSIKNNCLILLRTGGKYVEVKQVFRFNNLILFKYNNDWYASRSTAGIFYIDDYSLPYIKKRFRKDLVVESMHVIYPLFNKENTMYVANDYTINTKLKNIKLYPLNSSSLKFDPVIMCQAKAYSKTSNYYCCPRSGSSFHKSFDCVTPFSFIKLFNKKELRKIGSGQHETTYHLKLSLPLAKGLQLNNTRLYRPGVLSGTARFDDSTNKYSLRDSGGNQCMDFVKTNSATDYFVSQFLTEMFSYTKEDVMTWYKHILELFKDLYTEKDIKLDLVEISKDYTNFLKHDGLNVNYWHIKLSKKIPAYHKYLFAIIFRYCYCSYQYSFPVKIMDLIKNKKLDMWTAIKTVLNSCKKETDWDIAEHYNSIPMDLSLEEYLKRVKHYDKGQERFTQVSNY